MERKTFAFVAVVAFLILAIVVAGLTASRGADASLPLPPSTYLAAPTGASALFETLDRGGVPVERWRHSFFALAAADSGRPAPLFVVLGPGAGLSEEDAGLLIDQAQRGPLLLAGPTTLAAMRCWGWSVVYRGSDSIGVRWHDALLTDAPPYAHWVLARADNDTTEKGGFDQFAGKQSASCGRLAAGADTVLETAGRRPVLVRVHTKAGYPVFLLSDPSVLDNRTLRESDLAPALLRFVAGAGPGIRIDEYHQGFASGGGMLPALLDWSERSPWGWLGWQLLGVGVLAFLVAAPRTGPIRSVIRRARRSPLEHVRALATALRAARGHDVAVDLLVRGLRRRLSRDGRAPREPATRWLRQLQDRVRSPRAHAAVARLERLTTPGRSADEVLAAANAVEAVWQELRP